MSININVAPSPRVWRGYDDPGLPEGAYIGHGVSVGDATGGQNGLTFNFKLGGEASSGRFYNIEAMAAHITTATQTNLSIQVLNFDRLGPFLIASRRYRTELHVDGDAVAAMHYQQGNPPMPLFLGQVSRLANSITRIIFEVNNVNTEVFSVTIQGYIWGPRSIMAQGGLRRPADSLYGR